MIGLSELFLILIALTGLLFVVAVIVFGVLWKRHQSPRQSPNSPDKFPVPPRITK